MLLGRLVFSVENAVRASIGDDDDDVDCIKVKREMN